MDTNKIAVKVVISGVIAYSSAQEYDSALLILSPHVNTLSRDVTMRAVHFWGQERGYLVDQRVSPVTKKERKGRGI